MQGAVVSTPRDQDSLRVLALSRIPRCERCPRFAVLRRAIEAGRRPGIFLPPTPRECRHRVCAPMAARFACDGPDDA